MAVVDCVWGAGRDVGLARLAFAETLSALNFGAVGVLVINARAPPIHDVDAGYRGGPQSPTTFLGSEGIKKVAGYLVRRDDLQSELKHFEHVNELLAVEEFDW